ncbi:AAA family ATPase [Devosia sp.]|uniref:AAA family ATPase n=1 Tax=Devosia sp. TaxID=1871048 RepID=UPI003A94AE11
MTVTEVAIKGYRSVRRLRLPLRQLTVLIGGNGAGKTNLYRSLELLHAAARGTIADEIAREGGLASIFWAGGRNLTDDGRFDPMHRTDGYRAHEGGNRLELSVRLEIDEIAAEYALSLGFPQKAVSPAFPHEAQIKTESLELIGRRRTELLTRDRAGIWMRDAEGRRELLAEGALASETALSSVGSGRPEISLIRQELANWRFFHAFRSDLDSPLRRPGRAVTAPMLASDGSNLAAVLATLRHIRQDSVDLDEMIAAAFPGARLEVPLPAEHASFGMVFPETPKRVFAAHELSDGTLQFIALMGALLSYRLPPFIALNEPEASLHPDLLPTLAQAIARAAERSQVWVVTHSRPLADAIEALSGAVPREVIRTEDGTKLAGMTSLGVFEDE